MMFKVVAVFVFGALTLNYWPLAFVTVPLAIIWADAARRRRAERRRVLGVYEAHRDEQARIKLFRSI